MMIDLKTYGSTPAAVRLAEMMNEKGSGFILRKVSKILTEYNRTLNELSKIDSRIGINLAINALELSKKSCTKLPAPFDTYSANVLSTFFKIWLQKHNGNVPYKNRKK